MLKEAEIKKNQRKLAKLEATFKQKSELYFIGSDPTRLKIIYLLKSNKEVCVSDIAKSLDMTISAISHQLSFLERHGLVGSRRMGKMVCHFLIKKNLEINFCCGILK